jgi:hypothetical protein
LTGKYIQVKGETETKRVKIKVQGGKNKAEKGP